MRTVVNWKHRRHPMPEPVPWIQSVLQGEITHKVLIAQDRLEIWIFVFINI